MLRVAICDDDEAEIKLIKAYAQRYTIQYDNSLAVSSFSCGEELLENYKKNDFDLIILDVEMGKMDGIYVADQIRHIPDHDVTIMYVSNFPQYMQASFGVRAAQYLTKPISYDTFANKINEFVSYMTEDKERVIELVSDGEQYYLNEKSVISIESQGAKLRFTTEKDSLSVYGKISDYTKLCDKYMVMPNRSTLINTVYIHKVSGNTIELANGQEVKISRRRHADVTESIGRNMSRRII